MWLYRQFDKGILPNEGGVYEQTAKIIEIFQLIESLIAEKQEAEGQKTTQ